MLTHIKVAKDSLLDICGDLNMKSLTLEVNVSNTPAIKLYEKFGFKNLGLRKTNALKGTVLFGAF